MGTVSNTPCIAHTAININTEAGVLMEQLARSYQIHGER